MTTQDTTEHGCSLLSDLGWEKLYHNNSTIPRDHYREPHTLILAASCLLMDRSSSAVRGVRRTRDAFLVVGHCCGWEQ